MNNHAQITQKLWNHCNILRDDGLSYGDYVEQLTFLLFLKMADEQSTLKGKASPIPAGCDWQAFFRATATSLRPITATCWKRSVRKGGCLALSSVRLRARYRTRQSCAGLIDREEWSSMSSDVKGDAYEGLLQKNAENVKGGAGRYFTPRAHRRNGGRNAP